MVDLNKVPKKNDKKKQRKEKSVSFTIPLEYWDQLQKNNISARAFMLEALKETFQKGVSE